MSDEALSNQSNLWLADTLWRLGAVQFGDFTLGRTTVTSPIYVNLRLLIAHPTALQKAAHILQHEIMALQAMRHPQIDEFDVVCGVPFGGLTIGQAYSLASKVPLIYLHPHKDDLEFDVEGIYHPSQTALIVDDLIATGGTAEAAIKLIRAHQGNVVGCSFIVDLPELGGRKKLEALGVQVLALCEFDGH